MIGISSIFRVSIFRSPITIMLSYLFVAWFNEVVNSEKNTFLLFKCGGLYTKIIHHFFLEIVTSIQIVSEVFPSKFTSLFAMNASLALTILPLHICFSLCEKEETDNDLCGTENLEESRRIKKNQVESRIKKNQEEESRRIWKNQVLFHQHR